MQSALIIFKMKNCLWNWVIYDKVEGYFWYGLTMSKIICSTDSISSAMKFRTREDARRAKQLYGLGGRVECL